MLYYLLQYLVNYISPFTASFEVCTEGLTRVASHLQAKQTVHQGELIWNVCRSTIAKEYVQWANEHAKN